MLSTRFITIHSLLIPLLLLPLSLLLFFLSTFRQPLNNPLQRQVLPHHDMMVGLAAGWRAGLNEYWHAVEYSGLVSLTVAWKDLLVLADKLQVALLLVFCPYSPLLVYLELSFWFLLGGYLLGIKWFLHVWKDKQIDENS